MFRYKYVKLEFHPQKYNPFRIIKSLLLNFIQSNRQKLTFEDAATSFPPEEGLNRPRPALS